MKQTWGWVHLHVPMPGVLLSTAHMQQHSTSHWITRAPRPVPPATNILRIYSPDCWFLIFVSVVSVSIYLLGNAKLGTYYGVANATYEEVVLIPFR